MKTAVSLIFWTIFGAIAMTAVFTGHALGWIGTIMAVLGIKQALWPSKKDRESMSLFNIDAGSCGGCGD